MNVGQLIEATVYEIHDDWAVVEYKNQSATLQATEFTWDVTKRPIVAKNFLVTGQKINLIVTAVEGDRFSVSLKQTLTNPWEDPPKVGSTYSATVTTVTEYGYFVLISRFYEALLHNRSALQTHNLGDILTIRVTRCLSESQRIDVVEVSVSTA